MITLAIECSPSGTVFNIAARKPQARMGEQRQSLSVNTTWNGDMHILELQRRSPMYSAQQRDIELACTLIACLVVPAGIERLVDRSQSLTLAPPGWMVHSTHCVVLQLDMNIDAISFALCMLPDFCIYAGLQTDETISTPEPVKDACMCSTLHIQGNSAYICNYRCPVHNDTEEHNCTRRNTVTGRG